MVELQPADRDRIRERLVRYVDIHSVNRAIDGGRGETDLASALFDDLASDGLSPRRSEAVTGDRDNVIATLDGAPGSPVLMLHSHLDTVGISGSATAEARVVGDRVHGRGACDTKASLVAMVEATGLLRDVPPDERCTVLVAGTIDEEVSATGARALLDAGVSPDMAVVGEPTGLEVAVAHKGVLRFEIAVRGAPAHASKPHLGINAIYGMRAVLDAVETRYLPALGRRSHPLLGPPTASVSTIRGGTGENVVPSECVISLDRRLIAGESAESALAEIDAILAGVDTGGTRIERREPTLVTAALDTPIDHPLVAALRTARAGVLGDAGSPMGMTFGTDASIFAPDGVPCVVFGPGSIDQAHSDDEWVGIDETARAAEILAEVAVLLARRPQLSGTS